MKVRFLCIAVIATAVGSAFAQAPSTAHWVRYWSGLDGVFLPESVRNQTFGMGLDVNHDYSSDAAEALKNNPDAPYLCAALSLSQPIRHLGKNFEVRDKEKELCKAFAPTQQQLEEVRRILYPPPPPHHTVIAQKLQTANTTGERWVGGVYYPGPAAPMAWARGEVSGRDYRVDLEAEFNADPLIAARVCSRADIAAPQSEPVFQQQQATLKSVCAAFPDQKIDAAYNAWHTQWSRAWLNGLLNSSLDEAASYAPDIRQQKEEEALAALSKMGGAMTTRFEASLRIIALAPDDWRGIDALLQHLQEATWSSNHNADPDVVDAWLTETYKQKSAAVSDRLAWKRGLRSWLVINGHLEEALTLAREIAGANQRDQHSRDLIYVAAIERALGTRASYDKLMSSCPAPDALYVRLNGAPSRPVKYCEDIVADFARAAREHLRGTKAGDAFAEMAVETNRVVPAAPQVAALASAVAKSPESETDDWFLSVLKAQEDRVAPMTKVQREEAELQIGWRQGVGMPSFEKAVYAMFLTPWRESAAAIMLSACNGQSSSQLDKPARLRRLVIDYYKRRAAAGPDAAEWKRGLRAVLLFTGDYAGARALSHDLAREHNAEFAIRDNVLAALSDRIDGNRKPLDEVIAHCPGTPRVEAEQWGLDQELDKTNYCRMMLLWDIDRAIALAPRATLPHAYIEFLQESAAPNMAPYVRQFAIIDIEHLDLDIAKREWQALLNGSEIPSDIRDQAFLGLASIAKLQKRWSEGLEWVDDYIKTNLRSPVGFSPELWRTFADFPETSSPPTRNKIVGVYDLRFELSVASQDFGNARRTLEDLMTFTACGVHCGEPYAYETRLLLIRLAEAEVAAGQRQEPLRILGFVARNPLNNQFTSMVDFVRKKMSDGSTPVEPKREDRPWDSPARTPPKAPRPAPTKATTIST